MRSMFKAFTLIELLIVVAIIAILAAIAVPNFLEAQTRSKVSRCAADMRSIRTGLESYTVDNNKYPDTDTGQANLSLPGCGMLRLTTPVAYITSVPKSPFKETNIGYPGWPNPASGKNCTRMNSYLYVRAENCPPITTDASPADGLDDNYNTDRGVYIGGGIPAVVLAVRSSGSWMLKSVGPDNRDDRDAAQNPAGATTARVYDPTNGTVSPGDVVVFSDTQGFAQQR